MGMRRRNPEATKGAILEAAKIVYTDKGYTKSTIDDIVALSGVSKGGIYWHYRGKEEIFLALMRNWVDQLYTHFQEVRATEDKVEEKLRKLFQLSFRDSGKHIISLGTEFWLNNLSNPDILSSLQEIYGRYQEIFHELLFDGIVRREFKAIDIEELTLSLMGMIEGVFSYQVLMGVERDQNLALMRGLEIFIDGIRIDEGKDSCC
jgi:AcrR family transcriptional regulator